MTKPITAGAPVYVVTMRRWGDLGAHAYVLGVYRRKHQAQKEAAEEEAARNGKYRPEISEMRLDLNFRVKCAEVPLL